MARIDPFRAWRHLFMGTSLLLITAPAIRPQSAPQPPAKPAPVSQIPAVPASPTAARFVVLLDAAHGGDDPGGKLQNQAEKDLTLALSVRLRSLLTARGIPVLTTRESDTTVEPNRRAEMADHANAQACISLHASESGSGIHLFASSLAPAQTARIPAWKTAQAEWVTRSLALAGVLNSALLHAGLSVTLGRTALPTIDSMTCPAIAVEVAPQRATASADKIPLDDPGYQAHVTEALAAALLEWKTEGRQP